MASWSDYFKESMDSVHMPVPTSLFAGWLTAVSTTKALVDVVAKFGTKVTLAEVLGSAPETLPASVLWQEVLVAAGGITVAFYAGCVIGACVYATQRSLGLDVVSISDKIDDLLNEARKAGIIVPDQLAIAMRQGGSANAAKTYA